jgi:hypothetical protein
MYDDDETIDVAVIPFGPGIDPMTIGSVPHSREPDSRPRCPRSFVQLRVELALLSRVRIPLASTRTRRIRVLPRLSDLVRQEQIRPVLRSGMIASDPQTEYRRLEGDPTKKTGIARFSLMRFLPAANLAVPCSSLHRVSPRYLSIWWVRTETSRRMDPLQNLR